jgi:hypothetical protein
MKKELDNYLVEKYPKIFVNRYGDMKTTAMCWGFEHGDGWFWLLDQLCDSIQSYIDTNNGWRKDDEKIPQVIATQVKEKFGTLNFYFSGGDDYIDGMVRMAENMSANICEFCGSTEDVGATQGWISIICKNCYVNSDDRISTRIWKENKNNIPKELSKELRKIKIDKLNNNET